MLTVKTALDNLGKLSKLCILPLLVYTYISSDLESARKLQRARMGTFTFSYLFKKALDYRKDPKYAFVFPIVMYSCYVYNNSCIYKRELMKGQGRMYASRRAEIEKMGGDVWKY
uniref:Uncharacterized protein n=1 Tax=Ditylenchus dipsaci TaxID=166011 RepID=A0A915ET47_9BILA